MASRVQSTHSPARSETSPLTRREVGILRLIALGFTSVEVAQKLDISPRTVETHRANIHRKLGLESRAEMVRYAMTLGLLEP